jgi:hypothetical protein
MAGACSAHGYIKKCARFWLEGFKEGDHLEDVNEN